MSTVSIPDNIHFYKKNELNVLPVTITGGLSSTVFNLDRSKGIGKSEVATTLLGLPRSEGRLVLYEDTPQYGFDRNRWEAAVGYGNSITSPGPTDPNFGAQYLVTRQRLGSNKYGKRRVDIAAGNDIGWDPSAIDPLCRSSEKTQAEVYGLSAEYFAPIVYQDCDNNSITLEAWPAKYQLSPRPWPVCVEPRYVRADLWAGTYLCTLKSKETYRYEPGRVIGFTFGISTSVDEVSGKAAGGIFLRDYLPSRKSASWGCKNNTDSYLFVLDGESGFYITRESVFDENNVRLHRSQFIDPLDGTGPSKATIDFTKVTMFGIEFSWYGAIGATFFAYLPYDENNTKWIKIAELPSSNTYTRPALADPYMSQYFELKVPHEVGKPHFLRKHGTSVYLDGSVSREDKKVFTKQGAVLTPLKRTAPMNTETRNVATFEVPEKVGAVSVSQYNKTKFFPIDISAYFDKDVLLTVSVTRRATYQDHGNYTLGATRYPLYPIKVYGLTQTADDLFYNSTGGYRPTGTFQSPSYLGTKQNFRPEMYDYILPIDKDIFIGENVIYVTVPQQVNIDSLIRDLLGSYPFIYNDEQQHRFTSDTYTNIIRDLITLTRSQNFPGFNLVQGLELMPRVNSITRTGDRTLAIILETGVPGTTDGTFERDFDTSALDPTTLARHGGLLANYGPTYHGRIGMFNRQSGGLKIANNTKPVFEKNKCSFILKKNFYRNDAYCIVGAPFETGRIYYQRPDSGGAAGLISETKIQFLKNNNFFNNTTYPALNTTYKATDTNVPLFLKTNSTVYNSHDLAVTITGSIPDSNYFKKEEPYQKFSGGRWFQSSDYGYFYPVWGYADSLYKFNIPNVKEIGNSLPSVWAPGGVDLNFTQGDVYNIGLEVNTHDVIVRLAPANFLYENWAYDSNLGRSKRIRVVYQAKIHDILYKNKNGVYTESIPFYAMFSNNAQNIGDNTECYINGVLHKVYFRSEHLPSWNRRQTADGSYWVTSDGFYPRFSPDHHRIVVTIETVETSDIDYLNTTLQFKIKTVSPIFGKYNQINSLFNDDTTNANTAVIPAKEKLYFWFTLNVDLTGAPSVLVPGEGVDPNSNLRYVLYDVNSSYTPNWRITKVPNPACSMNNKFTLLQYDCRDEKGAKINSLNTFYKNQIKTYSPPSQIGADSIDKIALSGTSYTNETFNQKYLNTQININNNALSNVPAVVNKITYYVPGRKKTSINLKPIYDANKTQVLPTAQSSIQPFTTFFTVVARSVNTNEPANGVATINYEEAI